MDDNEIRQALIDAGIDPDGTFVTPTGAIVVVNFHASYLSSDTRDPQIVLKCADGSGDYCRATIAECKKFLHKK